MNEEQLRAMHLHEQTMDYSTSYGTPLITRVIGGWIYCITNIDGTTGAPCFVPENHDDKI